MLLSSPDFEHKGELPKKFTCQGEDINPALIIEDIPHNTQSLALIVDDPDAPGGTFVHWIVYNIKVTNKIEENSIPGILGKNDFQRENYGGPCPPSGMHHYYFKLYALDKELDLPKGASKEDVEKKMKGHILSSAKLIGLYEKE